MEKKPDEAALIRRAYAAGYQAGRKRAPVVPGRLTRLHRADVIAVLRSLIGIALYNVKSYTDPRIVRAQAVLNALGRHVPIEGGRRK